MCVCVSAPPPPENVHTPSWIIAPGHVRADAALGVSARSGGWLGKPGLAPRSGGMTGFVPGVSPGVSPRVPALPALLPTARELPALLQTARELPALPPATRQLPAY